jgi:lipid-A-disaccharide synthase
VEWVGHPVLETAAPALPREDAWRRYDLDPAKPTVALAPGSRQQEMRYVLPVLAMAGVLLARRFDDLQFLVPVSPTLDRSKVQSRLERLGLRAVLLDGMDYDALQLASAAAVCSGTATLEFACLGIPMVVVYRASRATTLQYRLFRGLIQKQRLAAMPNILMDREIVRELLGSAASPEAISGELERLLGDADYRSQVKKDLAQAVTFLGKKGASDRAAELVLELVGASE